jgi:hypothetical protein
MVNLALPCFSESSDLPHLATGRGETARCIRREKSSNVSARYARNAAADLFADLLLSMPARVDETAS